MDALRSDLCALALRTRPDGVRLFLAGGYGLLLKAEYLRDRDHETIAPVSFPRATRDLDVVLASEVVVDRGKMESLKTTLEELGYRPAPGRENYQWLRSENVSGRTLELKIDLLGQIPDDPGNVSIRPRRMRPHQFTGLHANPVPEAGLIHERAVSVATCRDEISGVIELPHPFSYMLLKLFAFEDRKQDRTVDYGRHHAFDLYRIVAMMTRAEWSEVGELREQHAQADIVRAASGYVERDFSGEEALGVLRIREYVRNAAVVLDAYPVTEFVGDLTELWLR